MSLVCWRHWTRLNIFTKLTTDVLKVNLDPLFQVIRPKLNIWAKLPLSLAGRINLIKMILLSKCLYVTSHVQMVCRSHFSKLYIQCSLILNGRTIDEN